MNAAEPSAAAQDGAINQLSAEVRSVMYLGDNEEYSLALADNTIMRAVEHNPTTSKASVGDRLALQFDAQAVVVLPQEELDD